MSLAERVAASLPDAPSGRAGPAGRRAVRGLWRSWLALRFRLFQRRRHGRLVLERVAGVPIVVLPDVFNPRLFRTGELFAHALVPEWIPPGSRVLDMGTGSGLGAIVAARWARTVVAIDVNPAAVRCARINVLLNGVEDRVQVLEGDLFAPLDGERFDAVLFNLPFLAGVPHTPFDRALRGLDVIERFAHGVAGHLAPGGAAFALVSSDGDEGACARAFDAARLARAIVAEYDLLNEVVRIHRLTPAHDSAV